MLNDVLFYAANSYGLGLVGVYYCLAMLCMALCLDDIRIQSELEHCGPIWKDTGRCKSMPTCSGIGADLPSQPILSS